MDNSIKEIVEDNPTIILDDGTKFWHQEWSRHRKDGPAITSPDGIKVWYQYDKLHRTNGPAAEFPDGRIAWWLYGEKFTFEDWCKKLNLSDEKIIMLRLQYG